MILDMTRTLDYLVFTEGFGVPSRNERLSCVVRLPEHVDDTLAAGWADERGDRWFDRSHPVQHVCAVCGDGDPDARRVWARAAVAILACGSPGDDVCGVCVGVCGDVLAYAGDPSPCSGCSGDLCFAHRGGEADRLPAAPGGCRRATGLM